MGPVMKLDARLLAEFKEELRRSREANPQAWETSTRLVGRSHLPTTLHQLTQSIQLAALPVPLRDALLTNLRNEAGNGAQGRAREALKQLTGLPTTKALRALCVRFGVNTTSKEPGPVLSLTPPSIEQFVRAQKNPYDLLLESEASSLLDLGAGDLSFALELSDHYLPTIRAQGKRLTLHCIERLKPGSKLGSLLHADHQALRRLRQAGPELHFQFWGDQDMFGLESVTGLHPKYTVVTCHAPATPTFALEPSRVSPSLIEEHLRQTKGAYKNIRLEGEEALEVCHGDRALIFPPWKFEIRGPLALLNLLSRRGQLCVLSSVDTEVFWEVLAQLVEDDRLRPRDVVFSNRTVPDVFGPLYKELMTIPLGRPVDLSQLTDLRQSIPGTTQESAEHGRSFRFRYVQLRRGAVFEGLPASRTARMFNDMAEEAPPWLLLLVPA